MLRTKRKPHLLKVLFFFSTCCFGLFFLFACKRREVAPQSQDKRPLVVCTTTMICDAARQIGGGAVRVLGIIPPKQDPHIYTPRPRDGILFRKAQLVLVNGLHLEGKMLDMIENAGKKALRLAEDKRIKIRKTGASVDPHVWWDASFFAIFAEQIRDAFVGLLPEKRLFLERRAALYIRNLKALHRWAKESIGKIPKSKRMMITSHDAFFYFGAAYGIAVDAVLGISTDAQARAVEPLRLAGLVASRKLDAIFHETSVSQAQNDLVDSIQRLARMKYKVFVKIAGPLFSDSLSEEEKPTGSYIGAFRANVEMIVRALGAKPLPFALEKHRKQGAR